MPSNFFRKQALTVTLSLLAVAGLVTGYFLSPSSSSRPGLITPTSPMNGAPAGVTVENGQRPEIRSSSRSDPQLSGQTPKTSPAAAEMAPPLDPGKALVDAAREADPELRRKRVLAILREWAASEPDAAARAALAWPADDRLDPIAAVLAGVATRNSDDALRLGTFFCQEDPDWAPEHGRALIAELAKTGAFSAAVSFALAGGNTVDGEERNKWLSAAFSGWAQREPQLAALAAANDLPETGMQQEALITVVSQWRRLNPQGPEKFLEQLPPGAERTALATALKATSSH